MIDPKLISFVNDEVRRGRTKNEVTDLLLGAGMTEADVENFWKEFLSTNTVPQGFDVVKPINVQKQEEINIPIKSSETQSNQASQPQVASQTPVSPPNPIQQASQQNQNAKQPKNYFNFLIIGVALIIIAVLAFTAFVAPGFMINHSPVQVGSNKNNSLNTSLLNTSQNTSNENNTPLLNNSNSSLNLSKENMSYITYQIPKTSISPNPNMTIQYPSNWVVNTSILPFLANVVFYPQGMSQIGDNGSVSVSVLSIPVALLSKSNMTLQSEIPQSIDFYYQNATIGSPENFTISNNTAYEYTLLNQTTVSSKSFVVEGNVSNSTSTPGLPGSSVFVFIQTNSNVYEIQYSVINNYSAFTAYLPIAQHMINSIKIG
jgi:hypothetical protein